MSREYVLHPFRSPLELQINYAKELNEQQFAAVTAPPGPSLVIAGAGSGKTRTLTYRVAYLLEQGIPPERILLLTFTNKAAREMMRRVSDLLGQELASLWGGTFHSIGNRILRQHAQFVGYHKGFSILDRDDSKQVISAAIADVDIDVKQTRFPKPEVLAEVFSLAANTLKTVPQVLRQEHPQFETLAVPVQQVFAKYQERKQAANAMDFDDLLALWLKLLGDKSEICELYQRRFQFLLIDEYQDTNRLQSDLIDLLAARHGNVMVVGDDAQSIYGWRGANFANILEFPKRYPNTVVYRIETNYRSTPEILRVANAAIAKNEMQFTKELTPSRKPGIKPVLAVCGDANEQAVFVAQRVLELRDEGLSLDRMAVLYRSHFHALELQMELTMRNIPFLITSGIRFFEQAHIKDLTAYLKLIVNPQDELSLRRLVQMLPGIGGKGAEKIWRCFAEKWSDALRPGSLNDVSPSLAAVLQACQAVVPKKSTTAWAQFTATLSQLEAPGVRNDASAMLSLALEAGYEDYLAETYPNYRNRLEDAQQLAVFARQFHTVEDFLTQLALLTNLENEENLPARNDDEVLRLSTVHQAKGLEFDAVFVIMLCDGLFPSARSLEAPEDEEEERRLLYVAITRARNELYLSYPLMRATYTASGSPYQRASRFLGEIPRELLDEWNLRVSGY
jgi:DNA helicase-2/ATP-dependent DNA helicase PcrA